MSIVEELAQTNNWNYNLLKANEECLELAELLIKSVTKEGTSKHPSKQSIIEEIGDLEIRLEVLKVMFGPDDVDLRVVTKLKKYEGYLKEGKYKGKI